MKMIHRLMLVLTMVFSLTLVPLASAAGDPSDGAVLADGGSDPGGGSGDPGAGGGGGGVGFEPGSSGAVPGVSTPRVILSGFTTNPEEVQAGEDFQVTFTLHNTSRRTRVQNMKVTLSSADAAFLPSGGSSSIFINRIGADQIESGSMNFYSLPSLEERPYQLMISVEYEDTQANAYSAQEVVAIPVKQNIRADASVPQLTPPQLTSGQEASLTFNIFNQGKTKLYNAKASIAEGQAVSAPEVFIGTIEPGTSGAVDMTVMALEGTGEPGPVTVTVSYEDVDGNVSTMDRQLDVAVMPPMEMEEMPYYEEPMADEGAGFPLVPVLVGVGLLLLVLLVVALVRRRRRRREEAEDLESLAALGEPLIGDDR